MSQIAETSKFIGRYNEITEVAQYLESAASGRGQIVLINGEAGIGKTRLISQVSTLPIGRRFNWLSAKCISREGTDPYLPFTDALKGWIHSDGNMMLSPEQTKLQTEISTEVAKDEVFEFEILAAIPMLGPKLTEDPSLSFGSFLIKEPKSEFSIKILKTLLNQGKTGLCITRIPPEQLCQLNERANVTKFWLSSKPGKNILPPSLTKISHEINTFLVKNQNNVILLDGLEYIMGHVEFNNVLRFINELVDSMAVFKSILLIPINPLTVDPKQLALLERNMSAIDISTLTKSRLGQKEDVVNIGEEYQLTEDHLKNGRDRMFESTTQQILNIAKIKPVVLFLDDLHWADMGALHLLHYLARAVENKSVAIIGSYRTEDLVTTGKVHPLQDLLDRLGREKLAKSITLQRLDKFETSEIIRSLFNNANYPEELTKFIHNETEGNPLFIEEVLRSLNESGAIKYNKPDNRWVLTKFLEEIKIPETVKEVVQGRINKLSKNMRMVLEIASVLGVEFEYNIQAKVTNIIEDELVTILDELIKFKLLIEEPTDLGQPIKYRFAHNKIREVLYMGLSESRKRLLHSKAAEAIEERYQGDITRVVDDLAQHFYHGAVFNSALKYSKQAGEIALRNFAPEKARIFYKWAKEANEVLKKTASKVNLQQLEKEQEIILAKLIEICTIIGEWDEALVYNKELLKLSETIQDFKKFVDANVYAGEIYLDRSEWPNALKYFKIALEIANKENYQLGLLDAYTGLGDVQRKMGEFDNAIYYYKKYMEIAKKIDSPIKLAHGYKSLGDMIHYKGDYNLAIQYSRKCIELLLETENYSELAKSYINMGVTFFELDDFEKAMECAELGIEYGKKAGNIRIQGYGYSNAAELYVIKDQPDKAMDYINKAYEIFSKLDEKSMIGLAWMNYGIIHSSKKEWGPAKYNFEKCIALLKDLNMPYYLADCLRQYGLMLAKQGTKESIIESKKHLKESLGLYSSLKIDKYIKILNNELKELSALG